jgi:hypothetical protein
MQQETSSTRGPAALSWVFYGLAVIVGAAGLLIGLSVGGASAAIPAAAIGFQSPALKPLWDTLVGGLQSLGWLVFLAGLVMAALIFCGGLLLSYTTALTRRVGRLEAECAALRQDTAAPRPLDPATSSKTEVHAITQFAN